ncbi:hypothetical protein LFAB_07105 [Lactiplantibacillus fabifermentans T30PCM01]|uniref:Uncharacterized protein n=1 Tax=Lactiplantibacillus fabifermentans T30PCM01 TaxID=1400520 RepID=W6T847_9LACO|nr:hypothetical protein [Lactiplantibacillus fabifermentans]ETY74586.1 hypothetical protein LFAB_07105 [Lactiplantibacillus fabifermentans T30PCM01]
MKLYIAILISVALVWGVFAFLMLVAQFRVALGNSVSKATVAEITAAEAAYYEQHQSARRVKTRAQVWYRMFRYLSALTIGGMNFWFAIGVQYTQIKLFVAVVAVLVGLTTISFVRVQQTDRQFKKVLAAAELKLTLPESTRLDVYSTWLAWMTMALMVVSMSGIVYVLMVLG